MSVCGVQNEGERCAVENRVHLAQYVAPGSQLAFFVHTFRRDKQSKKPQVFPTNVQLPASAAPAGLIFPTCGQGRCKDYANQAEILVIEPPKSVANVCVYILSFSVPIKANLLHILANR